MTEPDDAAAIRTVVDNGAMYRDSADRHRLASVWSSDAWMTATWFQGPATEFIEVSRRAFERGVQILHFLGGSTCDAVDRQAAAQTKTKIEQRATVHDVEADVTCTGRFYDLSERPEHQWRLVRRQPIYESDRIDTIDPAATLHLDREKPESFPTGYRHLTYLQLSIGYRVMQDLAGFARRTSRAAVRGGRRLARRIDHGGRGLPPRRSPATRLRTIGLDNGPAAVDLRSDP